jgi:hypothetical protein
MRVTTVGNYAVTIGFIVAILVLLFAVLGMAGVIPMTPVWVFGLVAALAVARLT